jgi:hypothetical protein
MELSKIQFLRPTTNIKNTNIKKLNLTIILACWPRNPFFSLVHPFSNFASNFNPLNLHQLGGGTWSQPLCKHFKEELKCVVVHQEWYKCWHGKVLQLQAGSKPWWHNPQLEVMMVQRNYVTLGWTLKTIGKGCGDGILFAIN